MTSELVLVALTVVSLARSAALAQTAVPATASSPSTYPTAAAATPESYAPQPASPWEFSVGFPVWIAGVHGKFTVDGEEFESDQNTDDVINLYDSTLSGAMVLHVEAGKGRAGAIVDGMYIDLLSETTKNVNLPEGRLEGFIGELSGYYTLIQPAPDKRGFGRFQLDALAGVRFSRLKLGIQDAANDDELSGRITLYDPIVGARLELGLLKWLSFRGRIDVGGFAIDAWDTCDFQFNIETGLEFHLARWFDVGVGYRWLNYDFDADSGNSSFDATLSGPVVAVKFNF